MCFIFQIGNEVKSENRHGSETSESHDDNKISNNVNDNISSDNDNRIHFPAHNQFFPARPQHNDNLQHEQNNYINYYSKFY